MTTNINRTMYTNVIYTEGGGEGLIFLICIIFDVHCTLNVCGLHWSILVSILFFVMSSIRNKTYICIYICVYV